MRAIFIGCVESSYRTLLALIGNQTLEIAGVVTKKKSSFNADFCSLQSLAEMHDIVCFIDVGNNQDELVEWLSAANADVIFCVGWPYLLNVRILNMAPHGVIGYHPTNLPRNRGRHPIIWTIALGLEQTASTFFSMVEEPDAGPIVDKIKIPVYPDDDARTLYERLMQAAETQIVGIAECLNKGTLRFEPQDNTKSNYWRKRNKLDGLIDWRMSSQSIHNLVRSLSKPYIGAHLEHAGDEFKVWRVLPMQCSDRHIEPGKVIQVDDTAFVVKTADGAVKILEHELSRIPKIGDYI